MGFLPLSEAPRLLNGFTKSVDVEKLENRSGFIPASDSARPLPIMALNQTINEIILTDAMVDFNIIENREKILISDLFFGLSFFEESLSTFIILPPFHECGVNGEIFDVRYFFVNTLSILNSLCTIIVISKRCYHNVAFTLLK